MNQKMPALVFALSGTLVACGGGGSSPVPGGGGGGGGPTPTPAPVSANTIGEALPTGMGTVTTSFGVVGGFTQKSLSQVMAFPPGTKVTIKNLAPSTPHTLNVLSTTGFPANPALSTTAAGGSTLGTGFASGTIAPGGSITVTLSNPCTFFIGCAFHY
ncbi:MAG TPA: hypothetical protein VFE17_07815, partial [Candidatus Baltobacteraceae bacterium]|nr:hypothetical protein [Candidatus Baltobacteraceae bacterium]